jgi:rhamnogalacturonan endolyase
MRFSSVLFSLACLAGTSLAAFGVSSSKGRFVVDTDGGLVFSVSQTNGDIVSLVYSGTEAQDSSKMSHIGSGLGSATVSATTIGSYIKITVATSTLTHYYIAKVSALPRPLLTVFSR